MKISIVTINYNDKQGLEKTLNSVFEQTHQGYEYVVVDGGSTDGGKELIEQHQDKFANWVSEPDNGIYNAMNKGLAKVTGDVVLFLNSGDRLYDANVLERVLAHGLDGDFNYGDLLMEDGDKQWLKKYPEEVTAKYLINAALPHQGLFIKKEVFDNHGGYNEDYRIVSDWLHYAELFVAKKATFKRIPFPVSVFDRSGISSTGAHQELHDKERKEVLDKLFSPDLQRLVKENNQLAKENARLKRQLQSRPVKLALKLSGLRKSNKNG
jgi:glycosyltransferase involved in cell wall biosynthesis